LGDTKSPSTLHKRALGIGRHIFGGHFLRFQSLNQRTRARYTENKSVVGSTYPFSPGCLRNVCAACSHRVPGAWGQPLLRMTFDFPENDIRMSQYIADKAGLAVKSTQ
jgi:hypothetical protein